MCWPVGGAERSTSSPSTISGRRGSASTTSAISGTEKLARRCIDYLASECFAYMSRFSHFPPLKLVQIVRVTITQNASGLLIAQSADLPGRTALAINMSSLDEAIRDIIRGYFADQGEGIRIRRSPGRNRNDLSTWEVETIEGDAELLLAAE